MTGSATFPYLPGPPARWFLACSGFAPLAFFDFAMSCGTSHLIVGVAQNWFFGCDNPPPDDWPVTLVDYVCDPLHLHFHLADPTFSGGDFDVWVDA